MSSPVNSHSAPESPSQRALILVVERNPAVQRLERFFLEQAGYSVEFASDGVLASVSDCIIRNDLQKRSRSMHQNGSVEKTEPP